MPKSGRVVLPPRMTRQVVRVCRPTTRHGWGQQERFVQVDGDVVILVGAAVLERDVQGAGRGVAADRRDDLCLCRAERLH